jgi:4-amino-4-deoxy-L-arabinose transferase-like glycosyltransferase
MPSFNYRSKAGSILIMLGVILALFWFYDYPHILLKRPQSVHSWRQCDGASIALNYYQHGMHFFKPEVHTLHSDGFTTGYACPSEPPVIYYSIAILYKLFGYHDFLFRLTICIFYMLGLLYLFRMAWLVIGDRFWAGITVLLLSSSTVLIFYGNNFLPITVGISFSFAAWYYFLEYIQSGNFRNFLIAVILFVLASFMKITELSGPIIIIALLLLDIILKGRLQLHTDKKGALKVMLMLMVFVPTILWIWYAKYFNRLHLSTNFSTQTYSIFTMNREQVRYTFKSIHDLWLPDYFMPATLYLLGALWFICFIFYRKADRIIRMACLFYTAGLFVFSLLWFDALSHHDYFLITFYMLPAFLLINAFFLVGRLKLKPVLNYTIRIIVLAFTLVNITYGAKSNNARYTMPEKNDVAVLQDLHTITSYLRKVGISSEDKVIFMPEICIRPLYLMNQPGWILPGTSRQEPRDYRTDSIFMANFLKCGAKYFITNNLAAFYDRKCVLPYIKDLYAHNGNIFIFRIPPGQENFSISEGPEQILDLICNVENMDSTGKSFILNYKTYKSDCGGKWIDTCAHSGKHSVLVNEANPYALQTKIYIHPLEIVRVCLFVKGDSVNCSAVLSGSPDESMYDAVVTPADSRGWRKLEAKFVVPSYFHEGYKTIYIWNTINKPVYLDDLEISIWKYKIDINTK